jgi:hypothetical protein
MKRFVWILLAVFCTALGQVQPVEPLARVKHACCNCDGRCGMPDCAPPAPHASTVFVSEQGVAVARPASVSSESLTRKSAEKFFAAFAAPCASSVVLSAPWQTAPAAGVPLFKAHCSFLI